MAIKRITGSTPSRRFMTGLEKTDITVQSSHKPLTRPLPKLSGRDSSGQISVRHHGGRQKRKYRVIDFKRNKFDIAGTVSSIEYDPNRSSNISLIIYPDGEKRYILTPEGIQVGDKVVSGQKVEPKIGNASILKNIPVGSVIHNIELIAGRGGQIARSAGSYGTLMAVDNGWAHIKMPSSEIRKINEDCMATIGSLGNSDWKNIVLGSAGRARRMGRRPSVRGVVMNAHDHPHGGGEGRSGIGMKHPKTPWGKPALGKKTRNKTKSSNTFILEGRKR